MARIARWITRRRLLTASLAGGMAALLAPLAWATRITGPCRLTPRQTEGPFYPVEDRLDEDNDLTFVTGRKGRADGQAIYVVGRVLDGQCRPVPAARVEIWQASARGRYHHPDDRGNPVPPDPHFQGWGKALPDGEGRYLFKTVHPGQYPAGPGWTRPSHIHFKLLRGDAEILITQMYFAGDPFLERDRIFLGVPPEDRARVVVSPEKPGPEFPPDAMVYRFDLIAG